MCGPLHNSTECKAERHQICGGKVVTKDWLESYKPSNCSCRETKTHQGMNRMSVLLQAESAADPYAIHQAGYDVGGRRKQSQWRCDLHRQVQQSRFSGVPIVYWEVSKSSYQILGMVRGTDKTRQKSTSIASKWARNSWSILESLWAKASRKCSPQFKRIP